MIWREKKTLLLVLGLLLAANTVFFFTYRVQYESRLSALDARKDSVRAQLEEARRARVAADQQVAAYRKIERDVADIFENRWSTEGNRLTGMITEIKQLAVQAQMVPPSYQFERAEATFTSDSRQAGPRANQKTGATRMGISFVVEGTYQQVRRLINMLELSDQFVIIDRIGLTTGSGERLTMNIHVKTLFRDSTASRQLANSDL